MPPDAKQSLNVVTVNENILLTLFQPQCALFAWKKKAVVRGVGDATQVDLEQGERSHQDLAIAQERGTGRLLGGAML